MVQLIGQHKEDGLLGVGLQITKANDIGPQPMSILALEFSQNGLTRVRKAKNGEFLEIEGQKKMSMEDAIKEYLLSEGKATATQIAEVTGFNRTNVSTLLKASPDFGVQGNKGRSVLYGVITNRDWPE